MADQEDVELQRLFDIVDRRERRKTLGQLERDIWISASRQLFNPGPREACEICGKFIGITHAHHVIPLAEQYERGFKYPDGEYAWLCPNHHAIVHMFILRCGRGLSASAVDARSRRQEPINRELSDDEFEKVMDLMRRSGRGPTQ